MPPHELRGFFHKKLFGFAKAVVGAAVGASPAGRLVSGIVGNIRGNRQKEQRRAGSVAKFAEETGLIQTAVPCVNGVRRGGVCVSRARAGIGAAVGAIPLIAGLRGAFGPDIPDITPTRFNGGGAVGQAVEGAFGMPAMTPEVVGTIRRRDGSSGPILRCMRGMVLGIDSLCYPKAVLPRRSKFRKWKATPRAIVSAGDAKAIRRAATTKDRVLQLAKDVGLHASKTKPPAKPKAHQHLLAAPAATLRVVSEETN